MLVTLAQEEAAKQRGIAAAREKKAAKKARRKERDAALKAANQPQPAASAAPTPANDSNHSQASSAAIVPADTVAASTHARATVALAASVSSAATNAGNCTSDEEPAGMPELIEPSPVDRAGHTLASDKAAVPSAPPEARQQLPAAESTLVGGNWADLQKTQRLVDMIAAGGASDSGQQGHEGGHKEMDETGAHADRAVSPTGDWTHRMRSDVGNGDDGRDSINGVHVAEAGALRDGSMDSSDPSWFTDEQADEQTAAAGPAHDKQLPATVDVANDGNVLSQLLGGLDISEIDEAEAQPNGMHCQSPVPPAEPESALSEARIEHTPAAGAAGIGADAAVLGGDPSHSAARRRRAAPTQDDSALLCAITQVGLLRLPGAASVLVSFHIGPAQGGHCLLALQWPSQPTMRTIE